VDEARLGADDFGQMGGEGDDVVLGLALDLVDALDIEGSHPWPWPRSSWRPPSGSRRVSACASAACASISNQILKAGLRLPDRGHFRAGIAGIIKGSGRT